MGTLGVRANEQAQKHKGGVSMSKRKVLAGAVAAAVVGLSGVAQAQTKLTIMVFQGIQNAPFFAAQTQGFFTKRGLDVDIKIATRSPWLR
jgi:ABC-type nitrate/sulfonate/bicarbonate transport system substrate-binding protein